MRKLLLAVATCGLIVAGASQPAQAKVFIGFGFGPGYHHFHHHCHWRNVKVKVWSPRLHRFVWRWKMREFCW
jgi:hypothetical protein